MKIRLLVILLLCYLNTNAQTSNNITRDSIITFYDSLFISLKNDYYQTDKIAWKNLEPIIKNKALKSKTFEESLQVATFLFDTIGANHTWLNYKENDYRATPTKSFTENDFTISFINEYQKEQKFIVKSLYEKYGYIKMPGFTVMGKKDSMNIKAQKMYNEIYEINKKHSITGWIIDLRTNTGGDVFPMLTALYQILGDGIIMTDLDSSKQIEARHFLKEGKYYINDKPINEITFKTNPETKIPTVVITSILTASAGENIAMIFKEKENSIVIGEETYGLLTANELVELPFNVTMGLTEGFMANSKGIYTKTIIPDIVIHKKDNFEELLEDGNIIEAIKYIDTFK